MNPSEIAKEYYNNITGLIAPEGDGITLDQIADIQKLERILVEYGHVELAKAMCALPAPGITGREDVKKLVEAIQKVGVCIEDCEAICADSFNKCATRAVRDALKPFLPA